MMTLACFACACGCLSLSLLKKRHRKEMFVQKPVWSTRVLQLLKCFGLLCLAGSLTAFIVVKGVALGLVYSLACFTLIALSFSVLLSVRPRWTFRLFGGLGLMLIVRLLFGGTW